MHYVPIQNLHSWTQKLRLARPSGKLGRFSRKFEIPRLFRQEMSSAWPAWGFWANYGGRAVVGYACQMGRWRGPGHNIWEKRCAALLLWTREHTVVSSSSRFGIDCQYKSVLSQSYLLFRTMYRQGRAGTNFTLPNKRHFGSYGTAICHEVRLYSKI